MSPKSEVGAWMKFYPADWLASVKLMPLEARGAYVDLLAYAWDNDLPNDVETLARIVGVGLGEFVPIWQGWLRMKFAVDEATGFLVNAKQEAVRRDQSQLHNRRSEAGKRGAAARWDGKANGKRIGKPDDKTMGTQDPGPRVVPNGTTGANAPARKPRRDGPEELRLAIQDYERAIAAPIRSDLVQAADAYRQRRVKLRAPMWDRDQWSKLFEEAGHSQGALIAALARADQAGWKSVHIKAEPKPKGGQSALESLGRKLRERGIA